MLMRLPHHHQQLGLTDHLSLQTANSLLMSTSLDALASAVTRDEPAKRDGEEADINIDLGKELAGDVDEGTHVSKTGFGEDEAVADAPQEEKLQQL